MADLEGPLPDDLDARWLWGESGDLQQSARREYTRRLAQNLQADRLFRLLDDPAHARGRLWWDPSGVWLAQDMEYGKRAATTELGGTLPLADRLPRLLRYCLLALRLQPPDWLPDGWFHALARLGPEQRWAAEVRARSLALEAHRERVLKDLAAGEAPARKRPPLPVKDVPPPDELLARARRETDEAKLSELIGDLGRAGLVEEGVGFAERLRRPDEQASAFCALAESATARGQREEGLRLFRRALEVRKHIWDSDSREELYPLVGGIGAGMARAGFLDEAAELGCELAHGGTYDGSHAAASVAVGLAWAGSPKKALSVCDRLTMQDLQGGTRADIALALARIGRFEAAVAIARGQSHQRSRQSMLAQIAGLADPDLARRLLREVGLGSAEIPPAPVVEADQGVGDLRTYQGLRGAEAIPVLRAWADALGEKGPDEGARRQGREVLQAVEAQPGAWLGFARSAVAPGMIRLFHAPEAWEEEDPDPDRIMRRHPRSGETFAAAREDHAARQLFAKALEVAREHPAERARLAVAIAQDMQRAEFTDFGLIVASWWEARDLRELVDLTPLAGAVTAVRPDLGPAFEGARRWVEECLAPA